MSFYDSLPPKKQRFCNEYVVDYNGKQAAIRAGYSENNASSQGSKLLAEGDVCKAISELMADIKMRNLATADRSLEELARIAFFNMYDVLTLNEDGTASLDLSRLSRNQAAAISEVVTEEYKEGRGADAPVILKTKVRFHSKLEALDKIMRHLGEFHDKTEIGFDDEAIRKLQSGRDRVERQRDPRTGKAKPQLKSV